LDQTDVVLGIQITVWIKLEKQPPNGKFYDEKENSSGNK
tara:strand:+ start:389 stop:505 length:117 start_codon:yes stop_codon:yes gene_type:complete